MKWSFASVGLIMLGLFGIIIIMLFNDITVSNEQDYYTLKYATEAAMIESVDAAYYRLTGKVKMSQEKFVENFTRRFTETSTFGEGNYNIEFFQIIEYPAKVSLRIVDRSGDYNIYTYTTDVETTNTNIVNELSAILDTEQLEIAKNPINRPTPTPTAKPKSNFSFPSDPIPAKPTCEERYASLGISRSMAKWLCGDFSNTYSGASSSSSSSSDSGGGGGQSCCDTGTCCCAGPCVCGGNCGGGCFLKGTKVVTINGLVDIDKIKVGDLVLTYNEGTKNNEYHKVINFIILDHKSINEELYTLSFDDKTNLEVSSTHKFYIKRDNNYLWLPTKEIKIGDYVMYADKKYHKVIDIKFRPLLQDVYNLSIENAHNFYVGEQMILVHNVTINGNGFNLLGERHNLRVEFGYK